MDEYQDTNSAQDMIFSAVSRQGENLYGRRRETEHLSFSTGDAGNFYGKTGWITAFDGKNYPAKIMLGKNFRSRQVTEFVNFVFRQLMSQKMGEMEYSREQELIPAADYPPDKQMQAELHLIDIQEEKANAVQLEAACGAPDCRLMTDGSTVWENGAPRPVRFGDVCILLRSPKTKRKFIREAFFERGDQQLVEAAEMDFTGKKSGLW